MEKFLCAKTGAKDEEVGLRGGNHLCGAILFLFIYS